MGHESVYTNKLIRTLKALPQSKWFKAHGGAFQTSGVSDLIGCFRGSFVAIEIKQSHRKHEELGGLTPLQDAFQWAILNAEGFAIVVYTDEDPQVIADGLRVSVPERPRTGPRLPFGDGAGSNTVPAVRIAAASIV